MLLGRKEQRVIRYILIPVAIVLIGLAIYFVAGVSLADMIAADVGYAVSEGKPSELRSTEVSGAFKDISDGTIMASEWVVPVTGEQYGEIRCEDAGLTAPLYYGDTDEILLKGAGQSLVSEFPGLGGTTLVGAHDTTFFAPLENMKEGNNIVVATTYGTFTYVVDKIDIIEGKDFKMPQDNLDGKEQLILYTCYPFGEVQSDRSERIIYTCSKTSGPIIGGENNE